MQRLLRAMSRTNLDDEPQDQQERASPPRRSASLGDFSDKDEFDEKDHEFDKNDEEFDEKNDEFGEKDDIHHDEDELLSFDGDDSFDVDDDNLSLDGLDDGADIPDMPPPYRNDSYDKAMVPVDYKSDFKPEPKQEPKQEPKRDRPPMRPPAGFGDSDDELVDVAVDLAAPPKATPKQSRSPFPLSRGPYSNKEPSRSQPSLTAFADLEGLSFNEPSKASKSQPKAARTYGQFADAPLDEGFSRSQPRRSVLGGQNSGSFIHSGSQGQGRRTQPQQAEDMKYEAIPTSHSQPTRRSAALYDEDDIPPSSHLPRNRYKATPPPSYSSPTAPSKFLGGFKIPGRDKGRSNRRLCVVCQERPVYENGGRRYPTCGLTCASVLQRNGGRPPPQARRPPAANPFRDPGSGQFPGTFFPNQRRSTSAPPSRLDPMSLGHHGHAVPMCVICVARPCRNRHVVTCSPECAERLCTGGADPRMCDYCRRRPKAPGFNQCGKSCGELAKSACLLCKSRPKFRKYHLCGKTCKAMAIKRTPMLLEAPKEHDTFKLVERKFNSVWQGGVGEPLPKIKHIYKIFESKEFLRPYDRYKRQVGNEVFRYHGTKRKCRLGSDGKTHLCSHKWCNLCQILRTSFSTTLANPRGSFGPAIYSSTASNTAYHYTGKGQGAVLVTKVVLGKVYTANAFNAVTACPPGHNSVVFDRNNGARNETVVYADDAIRPVFLIIFE